MLDSDLIFRVADRDPAKQKPDNTDPVTEKPTNANFMDLSGVACPMNFVKAKLKMEMMEVGETLELLLDDGRPIENVPASFKHEGQDVTEMTPVGDDHWRVRILKIKSHILMLTDFVMYESFSSVF